MRRDRLRQRFDQIGRQARAFARHQRGAFAGAEVITDNGAVAVVAVDVKIVAAAGEVRIEQQVRIGDCGGRAMRAMFHRNERRCLLLAEVGKREALRVELIRFA